MACDGMDRLMLSGKTALVTGSTSGIGLGIALALSASGANVMLNGFGDVDAARAAVSGAGGRVGYHAADLSRPADIEDLIRTCERLFGAVDILVNNAGIQHVASIESFPPEYWDAILAINLSAAFHTLRHALPGMQQRGWGRVINIASAHGLVASAQKAAYVASKHGLVGLTKVAALENAQTGVTVNALCPGWVLTPLVQRQIDARAARDNLDADAAARALLADKQPSLQFTTPEQLGALAVFLCSPAADNVRGATWSVDGGWTAQ